MSVLLKTGFTGDKELIARLRRFSIESRKQFRGGLVEIVDAKLVLIGEIIPYKTGKLKSTLRKSIRVGEQQVTAKIICGGPEAPYALTVHEDLHAKHKNGRRAKFVESVVLQTRLGEELADRFDLASAAR